MSRTNFHGPKDVRAIEDRLYIRTMDEGLTSINCFRPVHRFTSTVSFTVNYSKAAVLFVCSFSFFVVLFCCHFVLFNQHDASRPASGGLCSVLKYGVSFYTATPRAMIACSLPQRCNDVDTTLCVCWVSPYFILDVPKKKKSQARFSGKFPIPCRLVITSLAHQKLSISCINYQSIFEN